jgi:HEAT repeat protein
MRRTDPLVAAALEAQERERATGFATANPSLTVLSELEPDDLLLLVQELRSGSVAERELSARLLIDSALPGERTVDVVRDLLECESDPDRDVRWSATFEIAAWLNEPSSAIASERELDDLAARLRELGSSDPDREIRSAAAQGLRNWRPGPC